MCAYRLEIFQLLKYHSRNQLPLMLFSSFHITICIDMITWTANDINDGNDTDVVCKAAFSH